MRSAWVRLSARMSALALSAAVLAAAVLAACSPPAQVMVGLSAREGKPIAVFVACNRSLAILTVYETRPERQPAGSSGPMTWTVRSESPQLVTEIPLFGPPPDGWRVTDSTLVSLDSDALYSAGGTSLRHAVPVDFTQADLASLDPGQVLSVDKRRKVMTRAEFESLATGYCPR
jgi:hypothetical protein